MNHSKSGPFKNRTKIYHSKSGHVPISDPHCRLDSDWYKVIRLKKGPVFKCYPEDHSVWFFEWSNDKSDILDGI